MDLRQSYIFVVFMVILIHEVVFSVCGLKTHNRLTVDGFQRKERQAPIDPSRMYLPPRADSVAAGGFGDQNIHASNNFGDNAAEGYGEIALVQDTSAATATDGSSYDVPAKTADDGPSSSDGKAAAADRNGFGRYSQQQQQQQQQNKNDGELLSTAQNRGPTTGGGYDKYPDSKRDRAFSGGQTASGYGNAVPAADSFGGKSAAAGYGQNENPGGSASLIASVNDLQASPPGRTDATDGGGNRGRDEWSAGYQGGNDRSSAGGGFGSGGPLPSPQRGPESYGRATGDAAAAGGDADDTFYGRVPSSRGGFDGQSPDAGYGSPAPPRSVDDGGNTGRGRPSVPANGGGGGGYDRQTSSGAGFDQSPRGTSQDNNYGPTGSQTSPSGGNSYDRGISANGQNSYGPTGSQTSPSGGNSYDRGISANGQNSYGPTGSQTSPSGGNGYGRGSPFNGQNSPAYGGGVYTRGSPNPTQTSGTNNYAQIDMPGNDLPTRSSGRGNAGPSSGLGRPCHSAGGENIDRNGLYGSSSTRSPTDSQNKKKHSTIVPKAQYQNSNSPCNSNFEEPENGLQNIKNNGDFREPSPNAFSNFAPGSQPNLPNDSNDSKSNFGEPSSNAFSNSAPGSQPNLPNDLNDNKSNFDEPSPNAFSNFAPGSQPNLPNDLNDSKSNFDESSPNAFSNFAPGNQLNPQINSNDNSNYGEPGPNAFSNFAPDNQLNPPITLNDNNSDFGGPGPNAFSNYAPGNQPNSPANLNSNNCGSNNHGYNANTQYGSSVFSASNTGY